MLRESFSRPSFMLALMQGAFLAFLAADLLANESIQAIFKEGHAVEVTSALLYLMAAILLILMRDDEPVRRNWHLPVILVLMTLREFDLDKRLTSEGLLQLRLYSGPSPLSEKLIGAVFVLLILTCAWLLVVRTLPSWWKGIRSNFMTSWLVLGAASATIFAKSLDGIGRKLSPLGVSLSSDFTTVAGKTEELLELVAAFALAMAVVYYRRRRAD